MQVLVTKDADVPPDQPIVDPPVEWWPEAFPAFRGVGQVLSDCGVPGLEFGGRIRVVLKKEIVDRVPLTARVTLLVRDCPTPDALEVGLSASAPLRGVQYLMIEGTGVEHGITLGTERRCVQGFRIATLLGTN